MDKLKVNDFYGWHPMVLMASQSHYDMQKFERTTIRLYSEIDYMTNTVNYSVSESTDGETRHLEFNRLDDAVNCYNERLMKIV